MAWMLPRVIGLGRATELLMTGEFIDAREALRIGLYNRVVPAERVLDEARAFAEKLAAGPGFGIEMTKRLLDREASIDLAAALDLEAEAQAACMLHPDFREAYQAFVEKRAPRFR
jgi:enoyl-CoA hydratase/carnithine racemase